MKIRKDLPQHSAAIAHVNNLVVKRIQQDLADGHSQDALELLKVAERSAPSDTWRDVAAQVHLAESRRCLAAQDWPCTFAEGKEAASRGAEAGAAAVRVDALGAMKTKAEADTLDIGNQHQRSAQMQGTSAAIESWRTWVEASGAPEPAVLARLRSSLEQQWAVEKREEAHRRQEQAKRAREAALAEAKYRQREQREAQRAEREERRRAAREQREAERAARREREASRGLMCCDGSLSPSCMCRGSHQGCCSHHGGVCGCE